MVYIPNQKRGPGAQLTGVREEAARRKKEEEARRKAEEESRKKAKPPPPAKMPPPPTQVPVPPKAAPPPQQQVPPSPPREAPPPPPTQAPTPPTQVPPSYTPPPAAALPTPPPAATPPPAPPPAAAPTPPTAPPPPPPSAPPQAPAPLPPEVTGDVTPIAPPPGAIERSIPVTGSGEFGETPKEDAGKSRDELINEIIAGTIDGGKSLAETKGDLLAGESGFADYEKAKAAVRAGEATTTNTEFDTQVRQLMADLLAGRGMDVSTAEEEALIRELMQDKVGQGLVEQRARMGRAGFGASGALAAMEGDVRRQAGQQATQETLAIRRQAEQEAINNALRAVGVDVEKRAEARQQMFDEEFLSALRSAMGQEDTSGGGGGPLEAAGEKIREKGLVEAVPEMASDAWATLVKTVYGPNANPNDYYMSPPSPIPVKLPGR